MSDTTSATFRLPLTGLIGVFGLAVCVTPVAFGLQGLQVLYLLPLGIGVWLVRTRTVAGPESVTAHRMFGSRTVRWSELSGLRVDERSRVWAVLHSGDQVRLPVVRARDLPLVSAVSRGTVPDPMAGAAPQG